MALKLSSLTSPTSKTLITRSSLHSKKPSSSMHFSNKKPRQTLKTTTTQVAFKNPEPPWTLPPPPNLPGTGRPQFDNIHRFLTVVPISFHLIELRKWPTTAAVELEPIAGAINSLACVLDELHELVIHERDKHYSFRISRDAKESILWMFLRVFATSPNLIVGVLNLIADLLASSANSFNSIAVLPMPSEDANNVGVLEDRRMHYEKMIVADERKNSMILSNYAQFLYQYDKNFDKAEEYFKMAVAAEPVDGEAMNKYAMFLWKERGNVERAEEMFLEALAVEPENAHYRSSYSWFIWKTGAVDSCFPLCGGDAGGAGDADGGGDDDDDDGVSSLESLEP